MEKNIIEVLDKNNAGDDTRVSLQGEFNKFFNQAKEFEKEALSIIVSDISQTDIMEEAKELRKKVSTVRIETEKRRALLKAESLKKGRAIDGVANLIKGLIFPAEAHLKIQENFVKNLEKEKRGEIEAKRTAELLPYMESVENYDLAYMPEAQFQITLAGAKAEQERLVTEQKMLEEAIERKRAEAEAERVRMLAENAKLKAENEALKVEPIIKHPVFTQQVATVDSYSNKDRVIDYYNAFLIYSVNPIFEEADDNVKNLFKSAVAAFKNSLEKIIK